MAIVFVCSTHGFIDDFKEQKKLIEKFQPEVILSEELEDYSLETEEEFKQFITKRNVSNMTKFSEVESLVLFCQKMKIPIIGIDFRNFGFDENLQKKILHQDELSEAEEKQLANIQTKRELHHLEKIQEYSNPLIILGSWHLRTDSVLRKELSNYIIYGPLDEKQELIFEPSSFYSFGKLQE